jgi:hypothetical protein
MVLTPDEDVMVASMLSVTTTLDPRTETVPLALHVVVPTQKKF